MLHRGSLLTWSLQQATAKLRRLHHVGMNRVQKHQRSGCVTLVSTQLCQSRTGVAPAGSWTDDLWLGRQQAQSHQS